MLFIIRKESNLLIIACLLFFSLVAANVIVIRRKSQFSWATLWTPLEDVSLTSRYVFYWIIISLIFAVTSFFLRITKASSTICFFESFELAVVFVLILLFLRNFVLSFIHTARKCDLDWTVFVIFGVCLQTILWVFHLILDPSDSSVPDSVIISMTGARGSGAKIAADTLKVIVGAQILVKAGEIVLTRIDKELHEAQEQQIKPILENNNKIIVQALEQASEIKHKNEELKLENQMLREKLDKLVEEKRHLAEGVQRSMGADYALKIQEKSAMSLEALKDIRTQESISVEEVVRSLDPNQQPSPTLEQAQTCVDNSQSVSEIPVETPEREDEGDRDTGSADLSKGNLRVKSFFLFLI